MNSRNRDPERPGKYLEGTGEDLETTLNAAGIKYINSFIIFDSLGLGNGRIDTKIESVAFVLVEIRQVTAIVMSRSLSRSRVSST